MEHHHLLPLQDHLMVSSCFFNACGSATHFSFSGGGAGGLIAAPVALDQCEWAQNGLMQLGGEVFDGGAGITSVGTAADGQPWRCDGGGDGSSDGPRPAAATSVPLHGGGGGGEQQGVRERELGSELMNRDDGGKVAGARKRRDRAKTIVSERKRRVRMQEKLYELRSLVPNITKLDKASIIGDAAEYVRKLQSRATKLQEEVAALELARPTPSGQDAQNDDNDDAGSTSSGGAARRGISHGGGARPVARVGATRVGEGRFYVTVECERRDGAAAHLYAAVESLACFRFESSSLGRSAPDRLLSTFTLKATCQQESATIGEGTVRLLVMAALGEEGFTPEAKAGIS